jgi:RNA-directed DNA polymerase
MRSSDGSRTPYDRLADMTISPKSTSSPIGSVLSPLLANLLLDELDKELEKRGHRFVR